MSAQLTEQGRQHFFSEAPVLRWIQWFWRHVWPIQKQTPPSLVSLTTFRQQPIQIPTGIKLVPLQESRAVLYSGFLATHYSTQNELYRLQIPVQRLQTWISSGSLVGIEALDSESRIVGVVFSSYGGSFLGVSHSVITWFCIHPLWRATGVANALLRTIVKESVPRDVHWWRTDGLLKSPIPPVSTQQRMTRARRPIRSDIGTFAVRIEKQSLSNWRPRILGSWKQEHPTGLILDNPHKPDSEFSTEVWVMHSAGYQIALVVQPTFDVHRTTGLPWCDILWWVPEQTVKSSSQTLSSSDYSIAMYIEAMLDNLPYGWIEAPSTMPHLDVGWGATRNQSWSVLGLDPGSPVQRPILSLCAL